ncbi:zf-DHHC-domain-containing protein [Metschnikowia bicuspidata var. bicuspidata NRRL YB-4993]|uniref:Palmitoyltransferase n=1 Tax=Metschnikowia bicuspidata var. bicuspidata NRRL YB-4993 TaxID=869754 RepID=A0A1A0H8S5_9ASCO|nr:zf-DHHC-domain-containing protein [Metschnikowia bicuspidata var. bicuspidata NRRL YB-4993]OBA20400.1 zf-DHHC-domain-containing protein [Metschnikowia bicuspidata var. bicuspidata NRRL YB-4993]
MAGHTEFEQSLPAAPLCTTRSMGISRSPYNRPRSSISMLISQPSIMCMHGGALQNIMAACNWLLALFPKVFVTTVMTWAEYGLVLELHRYHGTSPVFFVAAAPLVALYLLATYTYFQVIRVGPGSPRDFAELGKDPRDQHEESPSDSETARETDRLAQAEGGRLRFPPQEFLVSHQLRTGEPAFRWCNTCEVWKPDRCHHCSTCQKCFLRMDHHCPWFASCIGHNNHKLFIQDLVYVAAFSGAVCVVSLWLLYVFFAEAQYENHRYLSLNVVFLFVVLLVFFLAVGCFAVFLVYMVLRNYTTIEFQDAKWGYQGKHDAQYEFDGRGQKKALGHLYDLGAAANWRAVMGDTWVQWLLPVGVTDSSSVHAAKNGLNFEVRDDVFQKYRHNAQLQEQLNAQLADYRDRVRGKRQALGE